MNLIVAIVQDRDAGDLLKALTEAGHRSTKLASSGGFLRSGNTTLMIGTENGQVEGVLGLIQRVCKAREELMPVMSHAAATGEGYMPLPAQVVIGGATVFVLDVDRFEKW